MNSSVPTTRRSVLVGAGAVFGVALTAGCGSDSEEAPASGFDGSTADGPEASAAPSEVPAETPAAEETAEADGAGSGAPALARLSDVPVGSAVAAKSADGKDVIIAQPTKGTVVGFSAKCTHQGCTVAPKGKSLDCPCHGAKYDAATGAVTNGPAKKPLAAFAVKLDGDNLVQA
jgi:cytochrome b6-f complex iron-sulfur subunit